MRSESPNLLRERLVRSVVLCASMLLCTGIPALSAVADWERLNDQAVASIRAEHFKEGELLARKELSEAEALGHKNRISISLNNLAKALIGLNKDDEAISAIERSVQLAKETQANFMLMADATLLGDVYYKRKDYRAAELCYNVAIKWSGKAPNITPDTVALLYNNLGGVLTAQSKVAEAEEACRHAMASIPEGSQYDPLRIKCARNFVSVLELSGKKHEAMMVRQKINF